MVNNGNGTISFCTICGKFDITVKDSFIFTRYVTVKDSFIFTRYGSRKEILEEPLYNLVNSYKLANYLHNPVGPAIIDLVNDSHEYWINGKIVPPKDAAKIKHDQEFRSKFEELLEEE